MEPIDIAVIVVRILIMYALTLGLAGPMTWVDRKQAAAIQDRVGPNRAGINLFGKRYTAFGLLHPVADMIKLITKEDSTNERVDRLLFSLAPMISFFPVLVGAAIVPFGPDITINGKVYPLQVVTIEAGLLYIFAVDSLGVFGVTLAGYASASKLALLGGLRAAAQMISYEVVMGLGVIGLFMIFGTLEPGAMVKAQGGLLWGLIPKWGIVLQPVGFIVFCTAAIAENKRVPFDIAEGESEIVGYFAEYSGMKFGMFYGAEYAEIGIKAAILATLFFGGWQVPYLMADGFHFPWGSFLSLPSGLVVAMQVGAFLFKLVVMVWFMMMIRWSVPRFRYDQVLVLGWKVLLPIALANLLVTSALMLAVG